MKRNHRIKILSSQEIESIYGIPKFNDEERDYFFSMNEMEKQIHDKCRSLTIKILFLLQLGYFKAKRNFFSFDECINDDLNYLKDIYPSVSIANIMSVSSSTKGRQQQDIMNIHGCRSLTRTDYMNLELKVDYCASISIKPSFIFREVLKYLVDCQLLVPSYLSMQDLIGKSLQNERNRIDKYFKNKLSRSVIQQLDKLLNANEKDYSLSRIKKDAKDFSYGQIRNEIAIRENLWEVYQFAQYHLPKLKLSGESIKYYASLLNHYSSGRLSLLPKTSARLYLICFTHYKVQKINNNLLKSFIFLVDKIDDEADEIAKNDIIKHKTKNSKDLHKAVEVLNLFTDEKINDNDTFGEVRKIAFNLVKKEKFTEVGQTILEKGIDREEFKWLAYEKMAPKFKKNIRAIFLSIDIKCQTLNSLARATQKVKLLLEEGKSLRKSRKSLALGFVDTHQVKYIAPNGIINADRYEFFLYKMLRDKLDSGDVYSSDSIDFRSFEDDLIPIKYFEKHKEKLLKESGLKKFIPSAKDYLKAQDNELHQKYLKVNNNLKNGKNKNLSLVVRNGEKHWKLKYTNSPTSDNERFFKSLPQLDIYGVMKIVDAQTNFSKYFTHLTGNPDQPNLRNIFASIIGLGINVGISKMGRMSSIDHSELNRVFSNYLSLENIRNAIDAINNATAKLSTFSFDSFDDGMIHSSSDGQKFETRYPTMKSRYSKKYFGLKKGVSAYSLVIREIPVNAMIIGSNDHESHFVFDIIHNNSTDIQTDQHSTDSHGINKANFFLLNSFGCQFAPRLNSPNDKISRLISLRDLRAYSKFGIKASEKANQELVEVEWQNVQRILVSLAMKSTTQSIIVKKLSSHKRQNPTKEAIWELDRIQESKYILDYIDDHTIPQNVQRSLNQGEQYHGLRRAIVGPGSSIGAKTDIELEIWNECSRLLSSCIIHYNSMILSTLIETIQKKDTKIDIRFINKISPIAWVHVNMLGKYDFNEEEAIKLEDIFEAALNAITPL